MGIARLPLRVLHDSSLTSIPFDKTSRGTKITDWVDPKDHSGEYKRQVSSFRDWVSREKDAKFPAEKGRYHLYVSYACPWVCSLSFFPPLSISHGSKHHGTLGLTSIQTTNRLLAH